MTREEAIAIIENEKKCVNRANKNDYCNRDCYNCELVKTDTEILTALDMAIKALEQQSSEEDMTIAYLMGYYAGKEPCEDAISRQAVIDQMYEWMNTCEYRKVNATDYFVNRINKLPSVNPTKTGHWIEDDMTYCGVELVNYKCDKCGEIGGSWRKGLKPDELPKYCMNCGTRMEEQKE